MRTALPARAGDAAAIGLSGLCLVHCLLLPVAAGLLPLIGLSIVAETGNIYAGLYYPITVAALTFVVGSFLLVETHQHKIWEEVR